MAGDDKWDFYRDARGEWKWRRRVATGEILGTSDLSFKNKEDCMDDAKSHGYKRKSSRWPWKKSSSTK